MLTLANKGRYMVKKWQKHVYVICEGSLSGGPPVFDDVTRQLGPLDFMYQIQKDFETIVEHNEEKSFGLWSVSMY